jgi:DNA-binding NtrC family response regulator
MKSDTLICLVEDDPIMGESLCHRFELEGLKFDWFENASEAMQRIGLAPYSVVVSDIRLPDLDGGEMFTRLRSQHPDLPPFIFITGFGSIDRAVQLLKLGAADYITKPFDIESLIEKIEDLARTHVPRAEASTARLGVSRAMRRIEDMLPRIASHADTVLLTGESGVGKERVALELHRLARDNEQCPFVAVNCGAISESLVEAELFGHEKGAFTGAIRTKKGYFEQAHCGTLFLDEIGEMPPAMQVKLLRAIQERRIVRVGGEVSIAVTLRIICATNRDLKDMVAHGQFREDVFYRINGIQIRIPPLRERKEDILWLARQFLDEFAQREGGARRGLSAAAEQAFMDYPWPGNIRELRHAIERACIISPDRLLEPRHFFEDDLLATAPPPGTGNLADYLHECERNYIRRALARHDWQVARTAESLGISRKTLWDKARKLGIHEAQGEGAQQSPVQED